jgi:hypothetical protein
MMRARWALAELVLKNDCKITVPRCHRKLAARTDFTGKYDSPLQRAKVAEEVAFHLLFTR